MIKENIVFNKNAIFWILFSSIFLDYIFINKIYYLMYLILCLLLLFDFLRLNNNKRHKVLYDKKILICFIFFCIYTLFVSIINLKAITYKPVIKLFSIYSLIVFIIFKLNINGKNYMETFYKYFTIIINIFAFINIFEIILEKSLFYNFILSDSKNWQLYAFGTSNFRTFSIFIHPIIYGVFLVVLFWCNKYMINNKFKYILQTNVIINLYFTKSRSAWIAFGITLSIYYLKVFIAKIKDPNVKFTYKKVINLIEIIIILIFIILIFSKDINIILSKIIGKFITVTNDSYNDVSRLQRLGTIKIINNYMFNNGILNFLFGNGINSVKQFMINTIVIIPNFTTTDNQYISFFYNFGFIGLLLYIFMIFASIINFFKNDNIFSINNLSILCFCSISIDMFFFESFGWTDVFIFLIIIMTFMCANDKKVGDKK